MGVTQHFLRRKNEEKIMICEETTINHPNDYSEISNASCTGDSAHLVYFTLDSCTRARASKSEVLDAPSLILDYENTDHDFLPSFYWIIHQTDWATQAFDIHYIYGSDLKMQTL